MQQNTHKNPGTTAITNNKKATCKDPNMPLKPKTHLQRNPTHSRKNPDTTLEPSHKKSTGRKQTQSQATVKTGPSVQPAGLMITPDSILPLSHIENKTRLAMLKTLFATTNCFPKKAAQVLK